MNYAIALKKKATDGKTVYLLKDGQFGKAANLKQMELIGVKMWKTYLGASNKLSELISMISSYATEAEVVVVRG